MKIETPLVLTFFDLKRLYIRHRASLWSFSVLAACCTVLVFLFQPLTYKSEALLKVVQSQGQINSKMKEMFSPSTLSTSTNSIIATMQSNTLLGKIVEEQGLQVKCFVESPLVRVWHLVKGNLWAQGKIPSPEEEVFSFSDVHIANEKLLKLWIGIDESGEWEIFDSDKKSLAKALLGSKMTLPFGVLTLTQISKAAKPHLLYPLKIFPWIKEVRRLRKMLKITPFKTDKGMVALEWKAPTKRLGEEVINGLMDHYQAALNEESESQLAQLYEQRDVVIAQYKEALLEHRHYLQHSIEGGFIDYAQEAETLSLSKNGYFLKLFDIDLELDRLSCFNEKPLPSENLNLQSVTSLLGEHTVQKDHLESQIQELKFLQTQLQLPGFELSTLGCVFEDEVTKNLVNKASTIALQLKDSNNRSVGEQDRLKEMLEAQKRFLSQYLVQMVDLKQSQFHLLNEKIQALKNTSSQLLRSERQLLQGKLHKINAEMKRLPGKWHQEALLALKQEQASTLLEGISHAIESQLLRKSGQLRSLPLDKAFVSYLPQSASLPLSFILTLFLAFISGMGFLFFKTLFRGFPVSDRMLRALNFSVSGYLHEKDTLRNAVQEVFIPLKASLLAVCLGGKHFNYSCELAELLSKWELKILVLYSPWSQMGPFEVSPIESRVGYDFLSLKGVHEVEMLCSPSFKQLISHYKISYDVILLYTQADPAKVEGAMLLQEADVVLITVQNETKENLHVYYDWSERRGQGKATFLFAEEKNFSHRGSGFSRLPSL